MLFITPDIIYNATVLRIMKKEYFAPYVDIIRMETGECIMELGSGNLPGGSNGHDMGGGSGEEAFEAKPSWGLWDFDSDNE